MGAFRELAYGVCFFVSAIGGAVIGVNYFMPQVNEIWEIEAPFLTRAIGGAIVGSVAWLVFKRLVLTPRKN